MPHQRKTIREAIKAAIVAGSTAAGSRVFESRIVPWRTQELPAISVYTDDETVDPDSKSTAPRELDRGLQLAIEVAVIASADVDDALDALAFEIERIMDRDETFGGVCSGSILSTTEFGLKVDGERPMGLMRMVYSVRYFTYAPDADDVPLDDFKTADIVHNLSNEQHENDQANDRLEDLDL